MILKEEGYFSIYAGWLTKISPLEGGQKIFRAQREGLKKMERKNKENQYKLPSLDR